MTTFTPDERNNHVVLLKSTEASIRFWDGEGGTKFFRQPEPQ